LLDMLKQYAGGSAPTSDADVHQHFDQVAQSVPQNEMAGALSHAFRADQTPAFGQGLQHVQPIQWRAKSRHAKSLTGMRRTRWLVANPWWQHAVSGGGNQVTPNRQTLGAGGDVDRYGELARRDAA
jgi:hypothetical protein